MKVFRQSDVPGNSNVTPNHPNLPNYNSNGKSRQQINMEIIENDMKMVQAKEAANRDVSNKLYETGLISNRNSQIEAAYRNSFNNIQEMLEGKQPLNLKKAVYYVESAFLPQLRYEDFNRYIKNLAELCKFQLAENGLQSNNPLAVNLAIQKVLSDTIQFKPIGSEKTSTHYPFTYDFSDPWGEEDYANMFVSKLLYTHSGQCHSLPLLYLIISKELGTESYLSFAPNHSYIKFKDERGRFYNYETTCGYLVSDNSIMRSGFISSAALKNKIYMDTLSLQETVAHCLNDLALGFMNTAVSGDSSFVFECTDLSLKYFPERNISAYMIKSNLYWSFFYQEGLKRGLTQEQAIQKEEINELWDAHNRYFKLVQEKGYSKISKEAYTKWLNSFKAENGDMTNNELYKKLMGTLKQHEN